jgi:hypothetical protein
MGLYDRLWIALDCDQLLPPVWPAQLDAFYASIPSRE